MTKQVVFLTANHIGLPDTRKVLHNFIEIYLFGNTNMTVFHTVVLFDDVISLIRTLNKFLGSLYMKPDQLIVNEVLRVYRYFLKLNESTLSTSIKCY